MQFYKLQSKIIIGLFLILLCVYVVQCVLSYIGIVLRNNHMCPNTRHKFLSCFIITKLWVAL